jgi:hypothetical protein
MAAFENLCQNVDEAICHVMIARHAMHLSLSTAFCAGKTCEITVIHTGVERERECIFGHNAFKACHVCIACMNHKLKVTCCDAARCMDGLMLRRRTRGRVSCDVVLRLCRAMMEGSCSAY